MNRLHLTGRADPLPDSRPETGLRRQWRLAGPGPRPALRALACLLAVGALAVLSAPGADPLPAKPARHFTDLAGVVPVEAINRLDAKLAAYERESSNQFVVAVFQKLPADASLEDFALRTAQAWGVGPAQKDNGIVLFVFVADRAMRLEVGYGLEPVVPDSLAERILREEVRPHLRTGDYATGLERGIDAVIAATRGEYQGSGRTVAEDARQRKSLWTEWLLPVLIVILIFLFMRWIAAREHGRSYSRRGRRTHPAMGWPVITSGGHGGFGGGGSGGGGFGGGGFSGGGGSFGGGGASGNW